MTIHAIFTSDNHLDPTAVNFGPQQFERRRDHLLCFQEVVNFALKERPDIFLVGGDFFDTIRSSNATRAQAMSLWAAQTK